ncbi:MAG: hypothetical protein V7K21_17420 [Nostoc sp.]
MSYAFVERPYTTNVTLTSLEADNRTVDRFEQIWDPISVSNFLNYQFAAHSLACLSEPIISRQNLLTAALAAQSVPEVLFKSNREKLC